MLGVDVFNGSQNQVRIFQLTTRITFPLLLKGADGQHFASGNHFNRNIDDIVVIDKTGTVRLTVNFYVLEHIEGVLNLIERLNEETPEFSKTDFNRDGTVDFVDFIAFSRAFGTIGSSFDLDGNDVVDFSDFLLFVQSFKKLRN